MAFVSRKPEGVNVADYMLDTVLRSSDDVVQRMIDNFAGSGAASQTADIVLSLRQRAQMELPWGRGLHSSTFRLNVSAFCVIGGAFRGWLRSV